MTLFLALLACGGADPTPAPPAPAADPAPPAAPPSPAPAAAAEPEAATGCTTAAAVNDPDPNGLNVRAEPKGKVLGTLPRETEVQVVDSRDGWLKISGAWHPEHEDKAFPEGWVHGSMLTTWLKTPADYGPEMEPFLRDAPADDAARDLVPWEPTPEIKLHGCRGSYVEASLTYGDGTVRRGWLGPDTHCPSTVTNCS